MQGLSDFRAVNYESVSVSSTAVGITSTVTSGGATLRGQRAIVTAETSQMRYRYDGTNPTTSEGHLLEVGQSIEVLGFADIDNFAIIATGSDGTIKVTLEVF